MGLFRFVASIIGMCPQSKAKQRMKTSILIIPVFLLFINMNILGGVAEANDPASDLWSELLQRPPYKLRKNHPDLKITVITFSSSIEELPMKDRSRVANFIWLEN
jgi:hypothetical protein